MKRAICCHSIIVLLIFVMLFHNGTVGPQGIVSAIVDLKHYNNYRAVLNRAEN